VNSVLQSIRRSNGFLYCWGWAHLAFAFICLCCVPWDDRSVTGVNPWIKPAKFGVSFTVYFWTLAFYLKTLGQPRWAVQTVQAGTAVISVVAMFCITMQAGRGVASHFNVTGAFDAGVFAAVSAAFLLNTMLILLVLFQMLWQEVDAAPAVLTGMQLGLFLFLLGSMEGLIMVLNQAHTVGAPDGGPGLPILNWSTTHGDLRTAHIIGLHGLQVLPLAGLAVERRWKEAPSGLRMGLVGAAAVVWVGLFAAAFWLARHQRPLLSL
jgi:hypothetical protein